jgi:hypothetical protein
MVRHLMTEHSSIVNERQISTYADMCEREIDDTELDACLVCSEKMSLSRLHSHLATHMEEIALFVLPLTQDDHENEYIEGIAESIAGRDSLGRDSQEEKAAAKHNPQELDAATESLHMVDKHEYRSATDARVATDGETAFESKLELEIEEKERERKAYDNFLREQKDKEEAKGKEELAHIDSVMRARLERLGWSDHDIEIALDPEKAVRKTKKKHIRASSNDGHHLSTTPISGRPLVFPRINRMFLDIETLEHYHVPWEWDRVSLHLLTTESSYCGTDAGAVKW